MPNAHQLPIIIVEPPGKQRLMTSLYFRERDLHVLAYDNPAILLADQTVLSRLGHMPLLITGYTMPSCPINGLDLARTLRADKKYDTNLALLARQADIELIKGNDHAGYNINGRARPLFDGYLPHTQDPAISIRNLDKLICELFHNP